MLTADQNSAAVVKEPQTPAQPQQMEKEEATSAQVLIIDDSNQICSLLVSGIINQCARVNRTAHVVQSSSLGLLVTVPLVFTDEETGDSLTIYTANCPKNAVPVLRLSHVQDLTIVCDIMTPADTHFGLLGLLRELTERKIRVNLVFVSSEGQNRYYVEELIKRGKAFFVEKGSQAWQELPYALVNRGDMFQFKVIVRSDYDSGVSLEETAAKPVAVQPPRKRRWWQLLPFLRLLKAS